MREKHREIFEKLTSTFASATIEKWEQMLCNWYAAQSNPNRANTVAVPNPFEEPASGKFMSLFSYLSLTFLFAATTLQDVRLELMKEEAAAAAEGAVSPHKMSLTSFLVLGLDLEDQQYVS